MRAIVELAIAVNEAPWALSRAHHARAHAAGLSDEDVLQVIAIAAHSGHLNRAADISGVALDYTVQHTPPPVDPSVPPWPAAPRMVVGRPAIDIARRPATANALAEWRNYIFYRDAPLTRRQRTLLARWVATWLGDGGISSPADLTANVHDEALRNYAELVTLAPWKIGDAELAPLRAVGFDDTAIFDATATVSSAGMFSRIEVALVALGTT
jgi:alkylhydroperoxidase family enzyme